MFFPGAPQEIVRIRWYFTDESFVPYLNAYNSHNWVNADDPHVQAGEIRGATRKWANGSPPGVIPQGGPFGSPDSWAGNSDSSSLLYPVQAVCFFDLSCWVKLFPPFVVGEGTGYYPDMGVCLSATAEIGEGTGYYPDMGVCLSATAEIGEGTGYYPDMGVKLGCEATVVYEWIGYPDLGVKLGLESVPPLTPDLGVKLGIDGQYFPPLTPDLGVKLGLESVPPLTPDLGVKLGVSG